MHSRVKILLVLFFDAEIHGSEEKYHASKLEGVESWDSFQSIHVFYKACIVFIYM